MTGKPYRLAQGGSRIDRARKLAFTFDGKALNAFEGDTVASAVMASVGSCSRRFWTKPGPVGSGALRSRSGRATSRPSPSMESTALSPSLDDAGTIRIRGKMRS